MAITKDTGVTVESADVINEILSFCSQGVEGRDLLAQAEYAADVQRSIGHQPGIARQELANKQARQAAHMAAGLAQFLARRYAPGVRDNGDLDALEAAFAAVILRVAALGRPGLVAPDGTTLTVNENGVLSAVQKADEIMEGWRKSWIGVPRYWRSTTLPDNHCWANGDFIPFVDWPELGEAYRSGGFDGMLLPWDASAATQAANLGKWRPNGAIPTGLYAPNLGSQFFRAWTLGADGMAGGYNAPGLPNIEGYALTHTYAGATAGGALSFSNFVMNQPHQAGADWGGVWLNLNASGSNPEYGASPTVMPPSINMPVIIYLGRPK